MRIEIICTGDEILVGKTVNTNFSYMSRKLEEVGLSVRWGTTVGDDRETLLEAFRLASNRADAVIVNGGLGPTVDDLSQEMAAEAAGVPLVLNEAWLERIAALFRGYGMTMQENNRKQALLPETAALIDNPIGTACGFELDIGRAHFFFTPGVPKELHLMLDQQIIPRLLAREGTATIVRLKRFHAFGLGESHADSLLEGIEDLVPDRSVKLGFQTHFPQLEIKLSASGSDLSEIRSRLDPLEAEVRRRLGNFIITEDDDTLEDTILTTLEKDGGSLTTVETFTGGLITTRLAQSSASPGIFRRGLVANSNAEVEAILNLPSDTLSPNNLTEESLVKAARAVLRHSGSTHALVTLLSAPQPDDSGKHSPIIWFAIATAQRCAVRQSRLRFSGGEWFRTGAAEMGLDSIRRFLTGLPIDEKIDFEKA